MPYITKAEQAAVSEAAEWLSLAQAVEIVCAGDGCDQENAQQQIRNALSDGEIKAKCHPVDLETADRGGRGIRLPNILGAPAVHAHWLAVKLDWKQSRIYDDFAQVDRRALLKKLRTEDIFAPNGLNPPRKSQWRDLRLSRQDCERVWPPLINAPGGPVSNEELGRWVLNWIAECKRQGVTGSQRKVFAAAQKEFGDRVTRVRVVAIYEHEAPEKWKEPGRPQAVHESPENCS